MDETAGEEKPMATGGVRHHAADATAATRWRSADVAALLARAAAVRAESAEQIRACRALRQSLVARWGPAAFSPSRHPSPSAPARPAFADPPVPAGSTVVVIAASAGGIAPLVRILGDLPGDFPGAVLVLLHQAANGRLAEFLAARVGIPIREARDGSPLTPGVALVCPAARHVRIGRGGRLTVWSGERIAFVRPSADVAFESLAAHAGGRAVAVVLSGCGADGAMGSRAVRRAGGVVIAEHDAGAQYPDMPVAAVDVGKVDVILPAERIATALVHLLANEGPQPV